MLSKQLQDFLLTYGNPEIDLEEAGEYLRSPQGASFLQWLPDELLTARRDGELTPDVATDLTGIRLSTEADVDSWLSDVWTAWFGQPYPDRS